MGSFFTLPCGYIIMRYKYSANQLLKHSKKKRPDPVQYYGQIISIKREVTAVA